MLGARVVTLTEAAASGSMERPLRIRRDERAIRARVYVLIYFRFLSFHFYFSGGSASGDAGWMGLTLALSMCAGVRRCGAGCR